MVYTSDSPAAALLEVCVHIVADKVPKTFELLRITGPEIIPEYVPELPPDWTNQIDLTQKIGSEWLNSGRSALLRVPSVLAPETWNYLLNPLHLNAALIQIDHIYEYPFDLRLKQ